MQVATEGVAATMVAVAEGVEVEAGEGEFFGLFLFLSAAPFYLHLIHMWLNVFFLPLTVSTFCVYASSHAVATCMLNVCILSASS